MSAVHWTFVSIGIPSSLVTSFVFLALRLTRSFQNKGYVITALLEDKCVYLVAIHAR